MEGGVVRCAAAAEVLREHGTEATMIKTILRHITRIVRLMLTAPARTLAGLLGTGRQAPPPETVEELVDEQVADIRAELETVPVPAEAPLQTLGERIHAYASADLYARGEFDFLGMPDDVAVGLCVMSSDQLARLAASGPKGCARWAAGEKGVVGVPRVTGTAKRSADESYAVGRGNDGDMPLPGMAA